MENFSFDLTSVAMELLFSPVLFSMEGEGAGYGRLSRLPGTEEEPPAGLGAEQAALPGVRGEPKGFHDLRRVKGAGEVNG